MVRACLRTFSCPQKMIHGKAEVFSLLISKEERRNQSVWGRAGLATGRRIIVVSKSGILTVVSMPFSFALIKLKVALLAPPSSSALQDASPPNFAYLSFHAAGCRIPGGAAACRGRRKKSGREIFTTNWTKGRNNSGQWDVCIENHD